MNVAQAKAFLDQCFEQVLQAASITDQLAAYLPKKAPQGKVVVVGAGKAAAAMAAELERVWPYTEVALSGLVVTRYEHACPTQYIEVVEASHPVPDEAGEQAAKKMLNMVQDLGEGDLVIALMSGGASSLLVLPVLGIGLNDKKAMGKALLNSGAPIEEMNAVRKHLSAIKGGRLAQAAMPAQVLTLAISDVVGDDLSVIGSGPTVPDETTFEEVKRIIAQYQLDVPPSVQNYLNTVGKEHETPKALQNSEAHVVITPNQVFERVKNWATSQGVDVLYLGDQISGEAKEVAKVMAGIATHLQATKLPNSKPLLLLSGGETTVTVQNHQGRGGRNAVFLLALMLALKGQTGIHALAVDTDGIDGSEDNAGAWMDDGLYQKAKTQGLDPAHLLAQDCAYDFFEQTERLLVTGPTRTNINDFRAILIV